MAIFEKDAKGKDRYDLIPTDILQQVAKVLSAGAEKYTENTWHTDELKHHTAAAMRHFEAFRRGDLIDEESELPHLAHAITNLMFLHENSTRMEREKFNKKESNMEPFDTTGAILYLKKHSDWTLDELYSRTDEEIEELFYTYRERDHWR